MVKINELKCKVMRFGKGNPEHTYNSGETKSVQTKSCSIL